MLPLLMLLAMACIDLGRAIHVSQVLGNAVQSGAQYAATHQDTAYTHSSWHTQIDNTVTAEMQNAPLFDPALLTITIYDFADPGGEEFVRVRGDYQFQTIVDWPGLPAQIPLRREVVQRRVR